MKKNILQFELWEECNNRCPFCYLSEGTKFTSDELKINSIDKALNKISDDDIIKNYNVLSYIGGEFFQGQLHNPVVKEHFTRLMKKSAELYNQKRITEFWLNATMTIGDQHELFEYIKDYNDVDNVWICTSYDTIGRFHTPKMLETWNKSIEKLRVLYPNIKLNVTMILTGDLISKYLSGEFSFNEFQKKYNCTTFLKSPGVGPFERSIKWKKHFNDAVLPNFFPKRQDMIQFLIKYRSEVPEYIYDKIYNINYRADDMFKMTYHNTENHTMFKRIKTKMMLDYCIDENNKKSELETMKCGHKDIYMPYVDSDACFICDKEQIQGLV